MPSYLDSYAESEEHHAKTLKRIRRTIWVVLTVLIVGTILYFKFRTFSQERRGALFLELLESQDYTKAHELWGCTEATPCRDYPLSTFLKDWGPESPYADLSSAEITKAQYCDSGSIITITFGGIGEENLWVERKTMIIGYAPWPTCNPRILRPVPY